MILEDGEITENPCLKTLVGYSTTTVLLSCQSTAPREFMFMWLLFLIDVAVVAAVVVVVVVVVVVIIALKV